MVSWVSIADLQLRRSYSFPIGGRMGTRGIDIRLEEALSSLGKVVSFVLKRKADYLFVLGDIFVDPDPPEELRLRFLNTLGPILRSSGKRPSVRIILGNHDVSDDFHSFSSLSEVIELQSLDFEKLRIVDKPCRLIRKNVRFRLYPWSPSFSNKLSSSKDSALVKVTLGHLEMRGSKVGPTDYLLLDKGLPLGIFEGEDIVQIGHIHKRQDIAGNENWKNVGSLLKDDFGERNEKKRFLYTVVNDDGSFEVKSFRAPGDVEMKEIEVDAGKSEVGKLDCEDAIVRTIIVGTEEQCRRFDLDKLRKALEPARRYSMQFDVRNERIVEVSEKILKKSPLEHWVRKNWKGPKKEGDEILALGRSLVKESE